jgi:hypothetical protein
MSGYRTDMQAVVFLMDVCQIPNLIDVDQARRTHQAEVHHRHKTLPTRKNFGIVAVFFE